ncbi:MULTISPECIES: GMC oxidoreductase [unclassified Mycolicibacterium]|uniref:GMC oxidoreductase n=1 Tax=unclassified Mycolicibacterium TaxID=2636767 RepID=UPI0012DC798E|nr:MULTISPECIES: GMC oxidoreductase [unclassified Mycolicibacterium]MUL81727.1 GMC family oxidoreductase [Mycolicibacterium sp. CBMA 329]MUL87493.1 GMC family oxidoreductase [Mycolicibacterium sp. CBMA 331]MUL99642.1 GMC family oxidoreductase [Mycolicibacterium sp. CBMA 334]MUM26739.1 GMC family oxidoreductase [Mycolicibacterium sp. CBMA 295]MUM37790.1 GMC family oxidoreductase [Mycolicibacterium sp. CBMA 247]
MTTLSRRQFLGVGAAAAVGAGGAGWWMHRHSDRTTPRAYYPAIVIGSGYGGGVSALRLAQAGIETLVVEKGRLWDAPDDDGKRFSKMLPADTRAGWFSSVPPSLVSSFRGFSIDAVAQHAPSPQPIQAGVCDKTTYGAHQVFRGVGVGGGSLVNAAVAAVPTPQQVAECFPDIGVNEFLGTYIERAKRTLRISYRDMDWFERTPWFQFARVGREYAAAAGYPVDYNGSAYSFDYMKDEEAGTVERSAFAFEQQFGNNYGRVGSVDQTYIASALATGKVTLRPLTEVTAIRREGRNEYVVSTRSIDRWGNETGREEIGCKQLFLSAGVLGTNQILLRARDTGALPDLNDAVGRGYGNNGDVMVAHWLKDSDPAGTQQSLLGLINLDGRANTENPVYATMFSIPLPVETFMLGYYVMVKTGDRADIGYDRTSDSITIDWPTAHTDHLIDRARAVFDKLTQANGVEYRDDIFSGETFAPNTVHPLGGCVRGDATDAFGRVDGYENLYVNDASLIPGYLGCNPFMSITALAERNIEAVLEGRR